jgi:hypothetical protein
MNFRGAQPYFDSSFQAINILHLVDRYDVRGPSSGVSNRPGSRCTVAQLLPPIYRKIIYNSGDLSEPAIGDGTAPLHDDKSPDCERLAQFLDLLPLEGGLWLNGDDMPTGLLAPGCAALSPYISFTVISDEHFVSAGINPDVKDAPTALCFDTTTHYVAYGGCPLINDFDVIAAAPPTSRLELNYVHQITGAASGATVAQTTVNGIPTTVHVILEAYSFHYIRNKSGVSYLGGMARHEHMADVIRCLSNIVDDPIAVGPNTRRNVLAQNYPNPFNPTTTIKYEIKQQAHVSLKIYNVAGQLVKTLVNEVQKPDNVKPVEWRGINNAGQRVSSGVYFYKLVTKDFTQTKKMVLLK